MKRLKPFFSYYGSKWRLSTKYPKPYYETIIEPFAGSACYSLLHHQKKVQLYDANEKIVMVWHYLINVTKKEILQLPLLEADEPIPTNIPQAAQYLIGFWCHNAAVMPAKKQHKNPIKRGNVWQHKSKIQIAEQLKYIRHWTIEHKDYKDLNNCCATWFIDPPYFVGGNRYVQSKIDYQYLANWCKSRNGQKIVCENDKANWLPFQPLHMTKGIRHNSKEVVYLDCDFQGLFNL